MKRKGFTLVEVLVSTAIITVVMLVAIGAIITVQDANRKAQAIRALIDNLHGAVENMSRKIRTGNTYHCGFYSHGTVIRAQDCDNGEFGTTFAFNSSDDVAKSIEKKTEYRLYCSTNTAIADPLTDGTCPANYRGTIKYYREDNFEDAPLIDPKIYVKSLRFYVHNSSGKGTNATGQPSVLITIKGEIEIERIKVKTPFNLQTTITQYIIN